MDTMQKWLYFLFGYINIFFSTVYFMLTSTNTSCFVMVWIMRYLWSIHLARCMCNIQHSYSLYLFIGIETKINLNTLVDFRAPNHTLCAHTNIDTDNISANIRDNSFCHTAWYNQHLIHQHHHLMHLYSLFWVYIPNTNFSFHILNILFIITHHIVVLIIILFMQ